MSLATILTFLALLPDWLDPEKIIRFGGLFIVAAIVFAESGLLIGFFLPGDSLLFTAGFFASKGDLNIWVLVPVVVAAAIIGDSVGYLFGNKTGPALFRHEDSRLFKQSHLQKAEDFFAEHGPKTIVLARFVPIVRTFAPIVAGAGSMPYRVFLRYNIIGGVLWGAGVPIAGYFIGKALGKVIDIDKFLLPIIFVIILLSLIPIGIEYLRHRRQGDGEEAAVEADEDRSPSETVA